MIVIRVFIFCASFREPVREQEGGQISELYRSQDESYYSRQTKHRLIHLTSIAFKAVQSTYYS